MNDEQKINILLTALEERYRSLHNIRERVQNICIWALGLLLAISGWLIQSPIKLTWTHKAIYISSVLIAFCVLRFLYLADLNKGFKTQQRVAARIERGLQFYKPRIFDDNDEPIYPKEWENSGKKDGKGKYFNSTYMLLYIGIILLIATISLKGYLF